MTNEQFEKLIKRFDKLRLEDHIVDVVKGYIVTIKDLEKNPPEGYSSQDVIDAIDSLLKQGVIYVNKENELEVR